MSKNHNHDIAQALLLHQLAVVQPGGGVDSSGLGSEAAKQQLKESKEQLEKELIQLKKDFWANLFKYWSATQEKDVVDIFKGRLDSALEQFKQLISTQQSKLEESIKQSQSKTEELNKFYGELNTSYLKWEKIKKLEAGIHQYKGVLENQLTKNIFGVKSAPLV